jgi:hypothetical protein
MNREPRIRLPLAGLLIIFVAPLATLMVVVPSLFAGGVQKIERTVPAIISRLAPNPSPHDHGPGAGRSGLPPVALLPKSPAPTGTPAGAPPSGPVAAPAAAPSPVPSPVVAPSPQPVLTPVSKSKSNHGRRRRRRPHEPLTD